MKGKNSSNYSGPIMSNILMFKVIMEHSMDSIYFKDKSSRFIAVNQNKAFRNGLKKSSELIGKTDYDYICEKDSKIIFEEEKLILETGHPIIGKIEVSTLVDGSKRHESVSKYPLRDKNGEIIGIWGISRDITEYELIKEALRESEERYSQLSEQNRTFTWEVDELGLYTFVDHVSEVVLGYPANEMIYIKHFYDLCPENEREMLKQGAFDVFKRRELFQNLINQAVTKDGHVLWLSTNGIPILNDDGILSGYRGSDTDITERKLIEDRLKKSEEKFRSYIEKAPIGIFVTDETGKYIEVNQAACQMTGYNEVELLNLTIADFLAPESFDKGLLMFKKMMAEGYVEGDIMGRKKNNDKYWVNLVSVKVADNQVIGFCRDISVKKNAEEQILFLSYHDQLTGLYNRRFYEEEIKRLDVKRNLPMTVIMGDVNGLKLINDSFGHAMGDELLKKTAEVIKKGCRADDIIARLGGDEFVILLPKTNAKDAEHIINRINELSLEEEVASVVISVSFGQATKSNVKENIQDTFKSAEDLMYRHKRAVSSIVRRKTVDLVLNTLYKRSSREQLHSIKVSDYCELIAHEMNFSEKDVYQIKIAGLMHDIGKIEIDEKILNKPEKLGKDEWEKMQRHPEIGYRILKSINEFSGIADDILEHHERWDGKGYPRGLKGEECSLHARIIAIADAFDAMTSDRSFSKAKSVEEAINELRRCVGTQFDPKIVQIFIDKILGDRTGRFAI